MSISARKRVKKIHRDSEPSSRTTMDLVNLIEPGSGQIYKIA
jgi:hypothetical protein